MVTSSFLECLLVLDDFEDSWLATCANGGPYINFTQR